MTGYSDSISPVPEPTAATVKVACLKVTLDVALHTEWGVIAGDKCLAPLASTNRRKRVEVAPRRLALVMVRQSMEEFSDRQTVDAVGRWRDWNEYYSCSFILRFWRRRS